MIHEAMVLEYSGRYLALVEWAGAMKLFLFMTLLANLFVPWGLTDSVGPSAVLLGLLALAAKLAVLTGAVAVLETMVAKLRLFRVPELLAGSFALAFLADGGHSIPMTTASNLLAFLGLVVTLLIVWRRSWPARLRLFVAQSLLLAALASTIGVLAQRRGLLVVAAVFVVVIKAG